MVIYNRKIQIIFQFVRNHLEIIQYKISYIHIHVYINIYT